MKRSLLSTALLLACTGVFAQSITEKDLQEIQGSFQKDASTKAIQNILTTDANIKANALNRELQGKIDHYFKYRVDVKGITDQQQSGRCWMFTSMNVLRPSVMKKYNISQFDFSHNYLYFWDIFEKSNLFLENIISTADQDMGDRTVTEYFKKNFPEVQLSHMYVDNAAMQLARDPNQFDVFFTENMFGDILSAAEGKKIKELRAEKNNILKDVYRILALCLGEPPHQFTWRYKTIDGEIKALTNYTPKQFYEEITPEDFNPENYIMVMNDPTREYYKIYEIQNYRNTIEGINWIYLNLPNEDIKAAALASIKNNEALYASCDVGKQFNSKEGILDPSMYDYESLLGVKLHMDKKARILTRQSGSAHAMTLIGCDTDENDKPVKWEFENSWGPAAGHNGYLTFTDEWFDEYMFRIVIKKQYLNEKALEALKGKPVQLPVWDYMY